MVEEGITGNFTLFVSSPPSITALCKAEVLASRICTWSIEISLHFWLLMTVTIVRAQWGLSGHRPSFWTPCRMQDRKTWESQETSPLYSITEINAAVSVCPFQRSFLMLAASFCSLFYKEETESLNVFFNWISKVNTFEN